VRTKKRSMDREALFNNNIPWVRSIARSVKQELPASFELDDLVQEGLIEMWRRSQVYDPAVNDSFQAYAYMAVRGAMLMSVRRRRWRDATGEPLNPATEDQRPNPEINLFPDEEAIADERRIARVRADIAQLPAAMSFDAYLLRRVFLEYVEVPELAKVMGIDAAQLGRRIAAAVRLLRRMRTATGARRG
jgi:RNA polymerase sigma factor (sigma-70 family)